MMQQYQRLRASVPVDTLLLFRLGDFYELFFDDAKEASGLLNLALTHRNSVPMCGMPYHAAPGYIAKLIQAGRRVAICDQTSEPQPGKIVTREITQIITAGTVSEMDLLKSNRPNYLGAVYFQEGAFGFAYAELSTGEFRVTQSGDISMLMDDLARISPAELLVSERQSAQFGEIEGALGYDDFAFLAEHARFTLCEHFGVKSLDGFGCTDMPAAIGAAGAIIHYLKQQLRRKVDHLTSLRCDARDDYVLLDAATQVNLELVESRGARNTSLLAALDRTVTPMGGRKLRTWILQPLRDLVELERRQQMIADLLHESDLIAALRHSLKSIRDLERASGRLSQASGNARDLVALKTSLQQIPELKRALQTLLDRLAFGTNHAEETSRPESLAQALQGAIQEMPELAQKLNQALVDDPPLVLKEGGMFRDGFNADLDELRQASRDGKNWITQLQEREIAETGIKSLKVRFNSVFGYFIEITKSNLANVPARYIRKQTTVGGERFITPELKEMEAKILGADERARQLEHQLFLTLREETLRELAPIQQTAERPRDARCHLRARRNGAAFRLLASRSQPDAEAGHSRWAASGARSKSRGGKVRAERHGPGRGTDAAGHHYRPEHGRQIDLHPAGRADRVDGADRKFCSGFQRGDRAGGSHFHPRRCERRSFARAIDLHGRDERNGEYREQRDRAEPRHSR